MTEQIKSEREERINKLSELKKLGVDPYPAKTDRRSTIAEVLKKFDELSGSGGEISLAGRLRLLRGHGNLTFARLEDASGGIQIAFSKKDIGEKDYKLFTKMIDVGDFIQVSGRVFLTKTGEKTLKAEKWKLLSKAVNPLPDKWHGFKDEEERLRKRYLDILFNDEVRE